MDWRVCICAILYSIQIKSKLLNGTFVTINYSNSLNQNWSQKILSKNLTAFINHILLFWIEYSNDILFNCLQCKELVHNYMNLFKPIPQPYASNIVVYKIVKYNLYMFILFLRDCTSLYWTDVRFINELYNYIIIIVYCNYKEIYCFINEKNT